MIFPARVRRQTTFPQTKHLSFFCTSYFVSPGSGEYSFFCGPLAVLDRLTGKSTKELMVFCKKMYMCPMLLMFVVVPGAGCYPEHQSFDSSYNGFTGADAAGTSSDASQSDASPFDAQLPDITLDHDAVVVDSGASLTDAVQNDASFPDSTTLQDSTGYDSLTFDGYLPDTASPDIHIDDAGCSSRCVGDVALRLCDPLDVIVDCPLGCEEAPQPHCSSFTPSNGARSFHVEPATAGIVVESGDSIYLDTDNGEITRQRPAGSGLQNGIMFVPGVSGQTNLIAVTHLRVEAGATLFVLGDNPRIILVKGDVDIRGVIKISTSTLPSSAGRGGGGWTSGYNRGGGGGGGHGTEGAIGGIHTIAGDPGAAHGEETLVPLSLGGGGGAGGMGGGGGSSGGAVQISSLTSISIATEANSEAGINAGGGGGGSGSSGGGGGGGGSILLEAPLVELGSGVVIAANGGGGGGSSSYTDGESGQLGSQPALGGDSYAGSGGVAGQPPTRGTSGSIGAGGGGAVGRIRVNSSLGESCSADFLLAGAVLSPIPSCGEIR